MLAPSPAGAASQLVRAASRNPVRQAAAERPKQAPACAHPVNAIHGVATTLSQAAAYCLSASQLTYSRAGRLPGSAPSCHIAEPGANWLGINWPQRANSTARLAYRGVAWSQPKNPKCSTQLTLLGCTSQGYGRPY